MRSLDNETIFRITAQGKRLDWISEDDKNYIVESYDTERDERAAKMWADNEDGLIADGMRAERVIPVHVLDQGIREKWDDADWKRWANSPEGRAFGIEYNGRVKKL